MKFLGSVAVFVCLALTAAFIIIMAAPQPASAQAQFYRNACDWSINSYCANRRAKGLPTRTGGWARRNGYSGYTGRGAAPIPATPGPK
jgi:hypothetical protein